MYESIFYLKINTMCPNCVDFEFNVDDGSNYYLKVDGLFPRSDTTISFDYKEEGKLNFVVDSILDLGCFENLMGTVVFTTNEEISYANLTRNCRINSRAVLKRRGGIDLMHFQLVPKE